MYLNNTSCDLYIGTSAGKKLLEELLQAKSSIKIVSPFVSPQLADGLVSLYQKGVDLQLVTSENDNNSELLKSLVYQVVHRNEKAIRKRHQLLGIRWFSFGIIALVGITFWLGSGLVWDGWVTPLLLFIAGMITFLVVHYRLKRVRVKTYSYNTLFPIRMLANRNEFGRRTTYLHSKIYIIDDRIAYLGSLNFTHSGTQHNYETRIRFSDAATLAKIKEEFDYLWNDPHFAEVDIDEWGARHFPEPFI